MERKPPFDLNLMRVVLALDQTRHVTRAAQLLDMSQSGFSSALARLRRHSGDALFVRTAAGMVPTPYARRMAEAASVCLATFEEHALARAVFDPATLRTEISFAMSDMAEVVLLPSLLSHFQKIAPNITVRSDFPAEQAMQECLTNGQTDIALGYFPDLSSDVFFRQSFYQHTFACIVRRGHPLVRESMSAATFSKIGHAGITAPSRAAHMLESWLQRHGIGRRVVMRTPHHLSLPAIIEATDLAATVPLAVAIWFARQGGVKLVALPFPPPMFTVYQYWHRRHNHDARHRWLRQQLASQLIQATPEWLPIEYQLYGKGLRRKHV